jgi:diacylglycerol O-acyltransferase
VFNCVATNVPGPRVPLYFAGAKMVRMMGTGPIFDGMGMINAIYSYGPDIAISFTSDRDMIPDPANYAAALKEAYEELLHAKPKAEASAKPEVKAEPAPAKKAAAKPVKAKAAPKKPALKKPAVQAAKPAAKAKPKAKK